MRSQTCSISAREAWGRMEIIIKTVYTDSESKLKLTSINSMTWNHHLIAVYSGVGQASPCQPLGHGDFYRRAAGTLVPRLVHGGNRIAVALAVLHLAIRIARHRRDVGDLLQRPVALRAIYPVAAQVLFRVSFPIEFNGIGGDGTLQSLRNGGRENVPWNDRGFVGQFALGLFAIVQLGDGLHQVGVALAQFGRRVAPLGRLYVGHHRVAALVGLPQHPKVRAARLPRQPYPLRRN